MDEQHSPILKKHTVEAVVVSCIDFRFQPHMAHALTETFGIHEFDLISLAGGAKNIASKDDVLRRDVVLDDILIATQKHHAQKIILLTHQNCGKYIIDGFSFSDFETERAFHTEELRRAGAGIKSSFPHQEILLGFMRVTPENTVVIERVYIQDLHV